jgi:hypothetical protein
MSISIEALWRDVQHVQLSRHSAGFLTGLKVIVGALSAQLEA